MLLLVCIIASVRISDGFYIPGVAPVEFKMGDPVEVKVRWIFVLSDIGAGNSQQPDAPNTRNL